MLGEVAAEAAQTWASIVAEGGGAAADVQAAMELGQLVLLAAECLQRAGAVGQVPGTIRHCGTGL